MENLHQFFSYNNDLEMAKAIFISLDEQLKTIHSQGYSVDVDARNITYANGFRFANRNNILTEELRRQNIEDLAKLTVGTYFSISNGGFIDYTHAPTSFFKDNYYILESSVLKENEDDNYYRRVLVDGDNGIYYHDYVLNLQQKDTSGKGNSSHLSKSYSTPQGRAFANKDEAAFVNLFFYPIIMAISAVIGYVIYVLIR